MQRDLKKMNIHNAHLYYEDFVYESTPPSPQKITREWVCEDCGINKIVDSSLFMVCPNCGLTDICAFDYSPHINYNENEFIMRRSSTIYKRRHYCIEKLKMMTGYKHSNSKKYNEMIKSLKEHKNLIKNISDLKKIMKKLKYQNHYKYIYNIYKDVTGIKLIELSYKDIQLITTKFISLEMIFKGDSVVHRRKNMISYDLIIKNILKELKYKCHRHILVPKKCAKINRIYKLTIRK